MDFETTVTPITNTIQKNLLLIDSRVNDYNIITNAANDSTMVIVFNYFHDTITTIKEKVRDKCNEVIVANTAAGGATEGVTEVEVKVVISAVGLIQHNYPDSQVYQIVNTTPGFILVGVSTHDPELTTWLSFHEILQWFHTEYNTIYFDMMACALYSNPDWKYVIDTINTRWRGEGGVVEITVRASTDLTGAASLGGNWFLESHTGGNVKTVYFTDAIEEYQGVLQRPNNRISGVILSNKKVMLWGNASGAVYGLGSMGEQTITTPQTPTELTNVLVKKISLTTNAVLLLDYSGNLYASGVQYAGEFGLGNTSSIISFTIIQTQITDFFTGFTTVYIIKNNKVYVSGMNSSYEFGNGNSNNSTTFIEVTTLPNVSNIDVIHSKYSVFVVYKDGSLYVCGANSNGQLGLGHTNTVTTFTLHPTMTNIRYISNTDTRTVFVKNNGDIYGCGFNYYNYSNIIFPGSAGNITTYSTPVFCFNVANIKWIEITSFFSCVILNDGTIKVWGRDDRAHLGTGTQTSYTTITNVPSVTNVSMMNFHYEMGFHLYKNGTMKSCGYSAQPALFGAGPVTVTANSWTTLTTVYGISSGDRLPNMFVYLLTPTITNVSNLIKSTTDVSFSFTDPSSNSSSPFTYTSSDLSVGTVVGKIFTVVGVGVTTITATQAATGEYDTGTATFTVTVRYNFDGLSKQNMNFTGANFRLGSFIGTNFTGSTLTSTDVSGATFTSAVFTGITTGSITNLSFATLPTGYIGRNGYIIGAGVNAQSVAFTSVDISNTSLANVDFSGATLISANMRGCNLSSTNFTNADLSGAAILGTTLTNTNFTGANIRNIDISGLVFTSATFTRIRSSGIVNGSRATMPSGYTVTSGTNAGYIIGPTVLLSNIGLSGESLSSRDLSGCVFSSCNLTNVDFSGATLTNCVFTGSNLTRAVIKNATITGVTFDGLQCAQLLQNPANAGIAALASGLSNMTASNLGTLNPSIPAKDLASISSVSGYVPTDGAVTVTPAPTTALYIVAQNNEPVNIVVNGVSQPFSSNGTQILDSIQNVVTAPIKLGNVAYKLYPGSIIALPIDINLYKVNNVGLYDILAVTEYVTGATGPTGSRGLAGYNGVIGATGPSGIPSSEGDTGVFGPTGHTGEVGATGPYGLVGFTGIGGEPGVTGIMGEPGEPGTAAGAGPTGPTGVTGVWGVTGPQGIPGEESGRGPRGITGITGTTGTSGGIVGMGPRGIQGPTGPYLLSPWVYSSTNPEPSTSYLNMYYTGGTVGIGTATPDTRYSLDVSGVIKTTNLNSISDYRVKYNIVDVPSSATVDRLRPVAYMNRITNQMEYGFIAHELAAEYPEMVIGIKDDMTGYQTIQYNQLFAVFAKEIKELRNEVKRIEMLNDEARRRV